MVCPMAWCDSELFEACRDKSWPRMTLSQREKQAIIVCLWAYPARCVNTSYSLSETKR